MLLPVTAIACARYVCQVSVRADFFGTAPAVLETFISSGTAITYNKTLGEPCWRALTCRSLHPTALLHLQKKMLSLPSHLACLCLSWSVPYAYPREFRWQATDLLPGTTYYARCFSFNGADVGPWVPSIPPSIFVDRCCAVLGRIRAACIGHCGVWGCGVWGKRVSQCSIRPPCTFLFQSCLPPPPMSPLCPFPRHGPCPLQAPDPVH